MVIDQLCSFLQVLQSSHSALKVVPSVPSILGRIIIFIIGFWDVNDFQPNFSSRVSNASPVTTVLLVNFRFIMAVVNISNTLYKVFKNNNNFSFSALRKSVLDLL